MMNGVDDTSEKQNTADASRVVSHRGRVKTNSYRFDREIWKIEEPTTFCSKHIGAIGACLCLGIIAAAIGYVACIENDCR